MPESLTPDEFELHVRDLRDRLREHTVSGSGDTKALLRDAEHVLELAADYPDVMERYPEVEGLVAEVLARRQQKRFLATGTEAKESPGCLLGWLFGRKG